MTILNLVSSWFSRIKGIRGQKIVGSEKKAGFWFDILLSTI